MSQKLGEDWKKLGRHLLNFDEAKLSKFHKGDDELDEKAYKMLLHWKKTYGSAATYQILSNALRNKLVNRRDLAEEFCQAP